MIGLVTYAKQPELTDDDRPLIGALEALGVPASPVRWDDEKVVLESFQALVLRSTWDYHLRVAEFERWLARVEQVYADRLLPVDRIVAEEWGRLDAAFGLATVDGLLAATARVHDLVLVTRNTKDVQRTGIKLFNPFQAE